MRWLYGNDGMGFEGEIRRGAGSTWIVLVRDHRDPRHGYQTRTATYEPESARWITGPPLPEGAALDSLEQWLDLMAERYVA